MPVSGAGPDRFAPLLAPTPTPSAPPARRRLSVSPLTLVYLVSVYLAWLSAGHAPFQVAYEGASKPSDFTRDFIAAKMLAQGQPLSQLDGERGNREAVRAGAEPVHIIDGSPFHLHPPPASLPVLLLVPLGYRGASALWLGLEVALLGYLAWQLAALSAGPGSRRRVRPWALFFLLILWPPVLTNFELGQWSIVLASLITAGYRAWDRDRPGRAAAWMATAAALKLMPVVLFAFVMRNRRAAAVFAAVMLGAVLIALPLGGGLDAWRAFARDVGINVRSWQTWWHNTVSIHGLTARLFVGSRAVRPLVVAPGLVRVLDLVLGGGLCGLALLIGRQAPPAARAQQGCAFALWNILVVILTPLAWTHYALLLALPAALVLRAVDTPEVDLPPARRRLLLRLTAVAVLMLTVPKESLYLLVRPLPVSPLQTPLMSLHLYAALLLFAAAALAARAPLTAPS